MDDLNKLQFIIDSSPNGIIAIDKNKNIDILNKSARQILNISDDKNDKKKIYDFIKKLGLYKILETGKGNNFTKVKYRGKLYLNNTVVLKDSMDEITAAVSIFQDVSRCNKICEELNQEKELNMELEAIIKSSYDGFYITDGDGYTLRINEAYKRITGLTNNVIGEHMQDLQNRGVISKSVTLIVLQKREAVTIMQKIKNKKDVIVTGNPVFDKEGNIIRVVTNVRDITELNNLKRKLKETKELSSKYYQELRELRSQQLKGQEIIYKSKEMDRVLESALQVSKFDSTVLLSGESGVGKELVAKFIHKSSLNKDGPYIKVNCGAIPANLLESELFGYEEGSFTGAKKNGKKGKFELAENGTLFLDEIGELPLNLQVKLLRAIQEKEITPIGGEKTIPVNVRIVAATNRQLEKMVAEGKFREDLYYRLNVVPISIPPLRERKSDIPILIKKFIGDLEESYNLKKSISTPVLQVLMEYNWPGNVRELKNLIERLFIMVKDEKIEVRHLSPTITGKNEENSVKVNGIIPIKEAVEIVEKNLIEKALVECGSTRKAGQKLGVHASTIVRKKQKYQIGVAENKRSNEELQQ